MWNLQDFCPFMVSGANVPVFWGGGEGGGGFSNCYTCSTQVRSFHFPFTPVQPKSAHFIFPLTAHSLSTCLSPQKSTWQVYSIMYGKVLESSMLRIWKKNRVVYRLNIKYAVWHVAWKEAIWHHVTFPYLYLTYFAPQGSIDMNF